MQPEFDDGSEKIVVTGRDLLDAATNWYEVNGNAPIPRSGDMGHHFLDGATFYTNDCYYIKCTSSESGSISRIPANTIPFLAGISLGYKTEDLAEIVKTHDITVGSISDIHFSSEYVEAIKINNKPSVFMTSARLGIEAAKCFELIPEAIGKFEKELTGFTSEHMKFAAMHSSNPLVWPATVVVEHARKVNEQDEDVASSYFKNYQGIISQLKHSDEMPNGSPADLIIRSGMTTEPVLRKQTGFFDHWEDVVFQAMYDSGPHVDILNYIAKSSDPTEQSTFLRGLLSISSSATHHEFVAQPFHKTLVKHFGHAPAFEPAINSLILKLNLFPASDYRGGLSKMREHTQLFDEITNSQETLLSRVAAEILARPAGQLGLSELTVFTKLKYAELQKQDILFSPEELVNKVMDSWDSFVTPEKSKDYEKVKIDEQASSAIRHLVKMLSRSHIFDCEKFNHRSDNGKVLLIESGMEVRKFKGLSRRALGRVLENDLGM